MSRTLGHTGIEVSDIGFGCWAIGGPFTLDGRADGYGATDDRESHRLSAEIDALRTLDKTDERSKP